MTRCYVYGVVGTDDTLDLAVPDGGIKGATVTTLECGEIAAVISPIGEERVRSCRADFSAHERVVEQVAGSTTILPLQFGVVMPDEYAVIDDFLAPNCNELADRVADLNGKSEHRLKATYLDDVALREVVAGHNEIRRLHQRIRSMSEAASYPDRIHLGELVASRLEELKADDAARIVHRVGRYAEATVELPARRDDVVVNVAFLVDHAGLPQFDDAVDAVARDLDKRMSFELVGPLAPWAFVSDDLGTRPDSTPADHAGSRRR